MNTEVCTAVSASPPGEGVVGEIQDAQPRAQDAAVEAGRQRPREVVASSMEEAYGIKTGGPVR